MSVASFGRHRDAGPIGFLGVMLLPQVAIKLGELKIRSDVSRVVIADKLKLAPGIVSLSCLDVFERQRIARKGVLGILLEKTFEDFDPVHSSAHFPSPSHTRSVQGKAQTFRSSRCSKAQM